MSDKRDHWENVYQSKAADAVSWYQDNPAQSLALIRDHAPEKSVPIIDVGAGASKLADALLAAGFEDLTLLDLSEAALQVTRKRLSDRAEKCHFIAGDVTQFTPTKTYAIWHDRAVFHFLTKSEDQQAYVDTLTKATHVGSVVIMATFAIGGPEKCSGLPIRQYDQDAMGEALGEKFEFVAQTNESHKTPWDAIQDFSYFVFRRR